ncbi:hypothetical protein ACWGJB_39450 [Streptomyces sp. NPDC054813]
MPPRAVCAAIQTLAGLELERDELLTRIADMVQRLAAEARSGDGQPSLGSHRSTSTGRSTA